MIINYVTIYLLFYVTFSHFTLKIFFEIQNFTYFYLTKFMQTYLKFKESLFTKTTQLLYDVNYHFDTFFNIRIR